MSATSDSLNELTNIEQEEFVNGLPAERELGDRPGGRRANRKARNSTKKSLDRLKITLQSAGCALGLTVPDDMTQSEANEWADILIFTFQSKRLKNVNSARNDQVERTGIQKGNTERRYLTITQSDLDFLDGLAKLSKAAKEKANKESQKVPIEHVPSGE